MNIKKCDLLLILAYLSSTYLIASITYLICTRNIGTPLKDAIKKDPKMMAIKKSSSSRRRHIFIASILLSIIILFIFRPFKDCQIIEKK